MAQEYPFSDKEYLEILELAFEVAEAIKGRVSPDGRKPDSQYLALKLYAHATTAYWLYTGTKSTVPASTGGSSFIDFSSIAVLTRSALETYLSFFEVFIAPKTDDEFEFNYCLWHLSGQVVRENLIPIEPAPDGDMWFHAKIAIEEREIRVYVNNAAEPALQVTELSNRSGGSVGIWCYGYGVISNLQITPIN